ncbi:hypothetical protein EMIT0P218_100065 [Pseudomonas sp. IT-P218]
MISSAGASELDVSSSLPHWASEDSEGVRSSRVLDCAIKHWLKPVECRLSSNHYRSAKNNTVTFQTKVVCSKKKRSAIIVVHPAFHFSPVCYLTG